MSHLTLAMVEQFFVLEEENARGVLRKEMDSAIDTIFKQMKQKLMQLVESGPGPDDTAHGLDHFADPQHHPQQLYGISNDTNHIPSTTSNSHVHLSDVNVSNLSQQGGSGDGVHHEQQLHSSSNQIASTSSNSRAPDNSNSNQDDQITIKNKLAESVNIIPPNEPIPPSSTQSQPSTEQFNDNLFDELDDADCDCSDCMQEDVDISQLAVDLEQSNQDKDALNAVHQYKPEHGSMMESSDNARHVPSTSSGRKRQSSSPSRSVNNNKRQKTVSTDGSSKYPCKSPGCGTLFPSDSKLAEHERIHLNIKPFSCTWPDCKYSSQQRSAIVTHIRLVHFKLPQSIKKQIELNIEDDRDPNEFVRVDQQLVSRRL